MPGGQQTCQNCYVLYYVCWIRQLCTITAHSRVIQTPGTHRWARTCCGVLVYIYFCVYLCFFASATTRTVPASFCSNFRLAVTQASHCVASVCAYVCYLMLKSLLMWRLINRLWEFHQIYNFVVVGTKMNWLDFEVKGLGHGETKCTFGQRHTDRQFAFENHLVLN